MEEGTPDHPGAPLETAELAGESSEAARLASAAREQQVAARAPMPANDSATDGHVVQAAMRESLPLPTPSPGQSRLQRQTQVAAVAEQSRLPERGTVVLDIEQGGIEVPSFVGKTVRGALDAAQDAGLELEAVGSGVARHQSPLPGVHVPSGSHVTVQFGR